MFTTTHEDDTALPNYVFLSKLTRRASQCWIAVCNCTYFLLRATIVCSVISPSLFLCVFNRILRLQCLRQRCIRAV